MRSAWTATRAGCEAGGYFLGVHRIFMQRFTPTEQQAIVANQRFVLSELANVDAGLLLGTDSGIELTRPGLSLHEEIAEWAAAGLTAERPCAP